MVKKTLLSMAIAAAVVSLVGCNVSTTDKYDNKIINEGVQYGSTSSVYPIFAPEAGQVPLAIDFLFADAGASDGTANTADTSPPVTTALNKLDGFSTVAPLYIEFSEDLDPATVKAGVSVHLVKLRNGVDDPTIDALDIETILASNPNNPFSPAPILPTDYEARYITMNDGRTPAIQILLKEPLEPKTKYLVVLTNSIKGANGETIGQSTTYAHAIGSDKIVNPDLAPVRGALQGWQELANGFLAAHPLNANAKGKAVFNYTFTTGGTDDVLKAMAAPGTFMAKQLPTYAHAEAAIKGSVEAQVRGQVPEGTPEANIQAAINQNFEDTLILITDPLTQMLDAANAGNPDWTNLNGLPLEQQLVVLKSAPLAGFYHQALITGIAQTGIDVAVSKPQPRDYSAIMKGAGAALDVPYDTFFAAAVKDDVEAGVAAVVTPQVEATITSVTIGEGAITQAVIGNGGDQTMAEATLDAIAGEVAVAINTEAPGTLPSEDGATIRPALKTDPNLQPFYLKGLQQVIIESQVEANLPAAIASTVNDLSSKGSIYQGGLSIPNYLPASEAGKADSELGTWVASDTAAQALGLPAAPRDCADAGCESVDPNNSNVTYRFPFADKVSDNVIPVFATLPATSECGAKPSDGWPVAIYQHGITVDRTAGVLVGNALAQACVAMVAIDHTMHGVAPGNATDLLFSVDTVSNQYDSSVPATAAASPFALARLATAGSPLDPNDLMGELQERHNNVGKNAAQANVEMKFASAGATADVGASGDLYINLQNFARTRDAMRQTVLDLMNLNATIGDMDVDADGNSDFDASKVYFVGHSLGAIIGTTFVAVNNDPDVQAFNGNLPKIQGAILGNGGGGVVKLLENSPSIGGAKILPGLKAAAGLEQGSADIEKFFGVMQAMVDSADPINFAGAEHMKTLPILSYEAVGGVGDAKPDLVVPNNALNATVATAKSYLAGTDPLVKLLGITTQYNQSTDTSAPQQNPDGIRANVRVGTGDHSTFSNANPQDTFAEIYGQIGSFIKSEGEAVQVTDNSVLAPAAE